MNTFKSFLLLILLFVSSVIQPMKRPNPNQKPAGQRPVKQQKVEQQKVESSDEELSESAQQKVKLKAGDSDTRLLKVSMDVAKLSVTIKNMLDDLGNCQDQVIPLHGVKLTTLKTVIDCLKKINEYKTLDEIINQLSIQEIYDLLLAANYLDVKPLLDACIKKVAEINSSEEVLKAFESNDQENEVLKNNDRLPGDMSVACARHIRSEEAISFINDQVKIWDLSKLMELKNILKNKLTIEHVLFLNLVKKTFTKKGFFQKSMKCKDNNKLTIKHTYGFSLFGEILDISDASQTHLRMIYNNLPKPLQKLLLTAKLVKVEREQRQACAGACIIQ